MASREDDEAQLMAENIELRRQLRAALQATTTATLSADAARASAMTAWQVAFRPPPPRREDA